MLEDDMHNEDNNIINFKPLITPTLNDKHLKRLHDSGISDEVIKDRGYCSIAAGEHDEFLERLHYSSFSTKTGLFIPFFNVRGKSHSAQLRVDDPELYGGTKYFSIKADEGNRNGVVLDIPKKVKHLMMDSEVPLLITEGTIKADSAVTAGLCCISIAGVTGIKYTDTTTQVVKKCDEWADIELKGRVVFTVFDNDYVINKKVQKALENLDKLLIEAKAEVRHLYLPCTERDSTGRIVKIGLDDWLTVYGNTPDKLFKLTYKPPTPLNLPAAESRDWSFDVDNAVMELLRSEDINDDKSNGRWFATLHAEKLRYNSDKEEWLEWNGKYWEVCKSTAIIRYAKTASDELLQVAHTVKNEETKTDLVDRATALGSVHRWKDMMTAASAEPGIECGVNDFNTDGMLLNCENGTIDLRTGKLREHCREDFITTMTAAKYLPDTAKSELWQKTLESIFANPVEENENGVITSYETNHETISFFQRAIGYSLTGDTREECFFALWGPNGREGKGTSLTPMQQLLGELYSTVPFNLFLTDKNPSKNGATPDLAALSDARMAVASEPKKGMAFDEAMVKNMTGNDTIRCRGLYSKPFSYQPKYKVWLLMNNFPSVSSNDSAFWDRCKVIKYERSFEDEERDKTLKKVLVTAENLSGILAWAVKGCLEWQRIGLAIPEYVKACTAAIREENNHFSRWLEDECVIMKGVNVKVADLTASYKSWVIDRANGIKDDDKMNNTEFGRALNKIGCPVDKATRKTRIGIRLKNDNERGNIRGQEF